MPSRAGRGSLAVLTLMAAALALLEEVRLERKVVSDCAVTGPLRTARLFFSVSWLPDAIRLVQAMPDAASPCSPLLSVNFEKPCL